MIIGVDQGYYATKTSEGIIFPSRISTNDSIYGDFTTVKIDNKNYIVGDGEIEVELNKVNSELTRLCTLTALALSSPSVEFEVVTGLPVGLYKTQKDSLKEMLLSNRFVTFEMNSKRKTIAITRADVFPQCTGAYYAYENKDEDTSYIVVDIGGRTVDICFMEYLNGKRKLTKYSTITEGTLPLYSKIIAAINSKYELSLELKDAEQILKKGLVIYSEKQDISFIKDIIAKHVDKIFQELTLNYPVKTSKVLLAGGGAYLFKPIFDKKIPGTILIPGAQFANAIGFKKVGESLWQKS